MLHNIKEVCELTGKSRSSIYRMFSRGDLTYVVGKDGKRRVETSELLRVFDDINFNDSPTLSVPEDIPSSPASGGDPYVTARELTDLRGLIHDLRSELDDIREDNRRLLRLLEYQTVQGSAQPQSRPVEPQGQAQGDWVDDISAEEDTVPVTEVAGQGWKAYRQQRTEQTQSGSQTASPVTSGLFGELGMWLRNFFLGEWQKR
ncbi:MAG: helix-turn-helix domain-containing protein [Gammaproteobacteria bacterium]|uniref:Helix-turn-helix domain-containing protein n=1 Tax=Candidatus Thiopontia autotrophica TaxID=2841688 RepID=A0A8J6TVS4_9GAMM|nr:helix-turn-helix domain-containing protein [Candidatus Thiopontia autotrophica]MBL6969667.1 helix-turn-helix domain-containing protein [Gammaproteobacteria bacterium]